MPQVQPSYTLTPQGVTREVQINDTTKNIEHRDANNFMAEVAKRAPFDTGFMPSGVRSYVQAGDHAQVVVEIPPGVNLVYWGEIEGQKDTPLYELAQPYQIIIGDFVDGNLLGARVFYSPYPITDPSARLYHQNIPNISCRGYRETSVGYICLYQTEDLSQFSVAERISKLIYRCSGAEPYNNNNMSDTDGPRFYESNDKPSYTWDPKEWETKSVKEGYEWTLDENLWIPIKVQDKDHQLYHDPNGVPLTLEMAMNGAIPVAYYDRYYPKMGVKYRTEHVIEDSEEVFSKILTSAFINTAPSETVPNKQVKLPAQKEIAGTIDSGKVSFGINFKDFQIGESVAPLYGAAAEPMVTMTAPATSFSYSDFLKWVKDHPNEEYPTTAQGDLDKEIFQTTEEVESKWLKIVPLGAPAEDESAALPLEPEDYVSEAEIGTCFNCGQLALIDDMLYQFGFNYCHDCTTDCTGCGGVMGKDESVESNYCPDCQ